MPRRVPFRVGSSSPGADVMTGELTPIVCPQPLRAITNLFDDPEHVAEDEFKARIGCQMIRPGLAVKQIVDDRNAKAAV